MEQELSIINKQTNQFALIVDAFAASIAPPLMYDSNIKHYGFRYIQPSAKHFCLLKAVRAVSGLNAAVVLAKNGFNQEVCVLIRTIAECTGQIDFILAGLNDGVLANKQQKVVKAYFEDFHRNSPQDCKAPPVNQGEVHTEVGHYLDNQNLDSDGEFPGVSAKTLMSNVYKTFSSYMHARYPEVMDMYGGNPGRFHMHGMGGTPKDNESIAILKAFTDSVALALAHMIQKFDMHDVLKNKSELHDWFPSE